MNVVPSKAQAVFKRLFLTQSDHNQPRNNSLNLSRVGMLYVTAAVFQTSWLYLLISNGGSAKQWINFPVIGWIFVGIWVIMAWCIPHLFFLGIRMIQLGYNPKVTIMQNGYDKKRQFSAAVLLLLGIILDMVMFPLMLNTEDKGVVVFMTALMGGRVMHANLEAIIQYYNH